jgi:hypothetical protein
MKSCAMHKIHKTRIPRGQTSTYRLCRASQKYVQTVQEKRVQIGKQDLLNRLSSQVLILTLVHKRKEITFVYAVLTGSHP